MELCKIVPVGVCPKCGNMEFVVYESTINAFLTNAEGIPIDSKNISFKCEGICTNCGRHYQMDATPVRFIPLTPMRKLLYEKHIPDFNPEEYIPNPMEKNDD